MTHDELSYLAGPAEPPVLDMTVGDLLRRAVAMAPDRLAVIEGVDGPTRRRWTYTELLRDAESCARALLARYRPGDHVAIWAPNIPQYTVFQCGAALAGMVMVTMNPTFREAEVAFSLAQSKAVACFTYREFRGSPMYDIATEVQAEVATLRDVVCFDDWDEFLASGDPATALPEVAATSPAQIQYTSGTTGTPKGAMIPHRGIVNDPRQSAVRAGSAEGCVWLAVRATLPRGRAGELLTRGYHTMIGYHDEPAATAATIEPDGWLHTGDVCQMDERGYISVSGRIKDMIIRGGENIYPREIEDALFAHEALAAAVVVGLPDDYYGEIAGAFVKLKPGHHVTAEELAEYLRPRLSGYKLPALWYFLDDYPQTLSGKVQKFRIRDEWTRGAYSPAGKSSAAE